MAEATAAVKVTNPLVAALLVDQMTVRGHVTRTELQGLLGAASPEAVAPEAQEEEVGDPAAAGMVGASHHTIPRLRKTRTRTR